MKAATGTPWSDGIYHGKKPVNRHRLNNVLYVFFRLWVLCISHQLRNETHDDGLS
jgi:hypothetical protein